MRQVRPRHAQAAKRACSQTSQRHPHAHFVPQVASRTRQVRPHAVLAPVDASSTKKARKVVMLARMATVRMQTIRLAFLVVRDLRLSKEVGRVDAQLAPWDLRPIKQATLSALHAPWALSKI